MATSQSVVGNVKRRVLVGVSVVRVLVVRRIRRGRASWALLVLYDDYEHLGKCFK